MFIILKLKSIEQYMVNIYSKNDSVISNLPFHQLSPIDNVPRLRSNNSLWLSYFPNTGHGPYNAGLYHFEVDEAEIKEIIFQYLQYRYDIKI